MSGARVLLSTAPFHHRPLADAFEVAAEAGFDGVELMVTGDSATQDAAGVAALAGAHGLPVPVVHGPFLLLTRRALGVDPLEKAARTLVMARDLGADLVIVHPPYRWQQGFRTWLDEQADIDAAAHGTRVAVENLYPVPLRVASPRFHTATRPEHLKQHRHVVLDTSHLAVTGVDLGHAWDVVGPRTAHLHVSDHDGGWGDRHLPIGMGTLPLGSLLGRVGRDLPAASVTLELHLRREVLADRAGLVRLLRVQRERCLALLGGSVGRRGRGDGARRSQSPQPSASTPPHSWTRPMVPRVPRNGTSAPDVTGGSYSTSTGVLVAVTTAVIGVPSERQASVPSSGSTSAVNPGPSAPSKRPSA